MNQTQPQAKPIIKPTAKQAPPTPFANGLGFGQGRADALHKGGNSWQVFVYPQGEGARDFRVQASNPSDAILAAWGALRQQRGA